MQPGADGQPADAEMPSEEVAELAGDTLLILSAYQGHAEVVSGLIELGPT